MTIHLVAGRLAALLCAVALLLLAAGPASAHVTANPGKAVAGDYARIDLRVPHGCGESPTTAVSVQIPDTIASVTPQFIPGWTVETTTGALAEPVELHGETVSEGIREITWSGGTPIPDGQFFDFGVSVLFPDAAGETLYFPVVQTCESGEAAWIEVPADGGDGGELESPAPAVRLITAAEATGAAPGAGGSDAARASEPVATARLAAADAGSGGDTLTSVALIVGALALAAAVAALVLARRRSA